MKRSILATSVGVVILFGLITLAFPRMWKGGYGPGRFEFEFQDRKGNPVQGVWLEVFRADETRMDKYLVKGFDQNNQLRSDEKGVLSIETLGQNFGGQCRYLFLLIPIGKCHGEGPVIYCKFFRQAKQVCQITYEELMRDFEKFAGNTLRKKMVIEP